MPRLQVPCLVRLLHLALLLVCALPVRGVTSSPLIVLDAHEDVLQRVLDKGHDLGKEMPGTHADLPKWRKGGLNAVWFSVWVDPRKYQGKEAPLRADRLLAALHEQASRHADQLALCDTAADVRRATAAGKVAGLIGVEGGVVLNNDPARVEQLRRLGVRYLTLTWRGNLKWAGSSQSDRPDMGLTPLGEEIVREMNRTGMVVDLSHVSDRTFYDVLAVTTKPVIVSHSNSRLLSAHPRNVTDDMLRSLAQNGGVVGVNFASSFLRPREEGGYEVTARGASTIETVLDHIDHIARVAGVDHVGLGSDFDGGIRPVRGLENAAKIPDLLTGLRHRGYTEEQVRKIAGENFLRVLEANDRP